MARSSKRDEEEKAFLIRLGDRIAQARAIARKSQREIAVECKLDIKTISRAELGEIASSVLVVAEIARVLNVSVDWLLFGTESPKQRNPRTLPIFGVAHDSDVSLTERAEDLAELRRRVEALEQRDK